MEHFISKSFIITVLSILVISQALTAKLDKYTTLKIDKLLGTEQSPRTPSHDEFFELLSRSPRNESDYSHFTTYALEKSLHQKQANIEKMLTNCIEAVIHNAHETSVSEQQLQVIFNNLATTTMLRAFSEKNNHSLTTITTKSLTQGAIKADILHGPNNGVALNAMASAIGKALTLKWLSSTDRQDPTKQSINGLVKGLVTNSELTKLAKFNFIKNSSQGLYQQILLSTASNGQLDLFHTLKPFQSFTASCFESLNDQALSKFDTRSKALSSGILEGFYLLKKNPGIDSTLHPDILNSTINQVIAGELIATAGNTMNREMTILATTREWTSAILAQSKNSNIIDDLRFSANAFSTAIATSDEKTDKLKLLQLVSQGILSGIIDFDKTSTSKSMHRSEFIATVSSGMFDSITTIKGEEDLSTLSSAIYKGYGKGIQTSIENNLLLKEILFAIVQYLSKAQHILADDKFGIMQNATATLFRSAITHIFEQNFSDGDIGDSIDQLTLLLLEIPFQGPIISQKSYSTIKSLSTGYSKAFTSAILKDNQLNNRDFVDLIDRFAKSWIKQLPKLAKSKNMQNGELCKISAIGLLSGALIACEKDKSKADVVAFELAQSIVKNTISIYKSTTNLSILDVIHKTSQGIQTACISSSFIYLDPTQMSLQTARGIGYGSLISAFESMKNKEAIVCETAANGAIQGSLIIANSMHLKLPEICNNVSDGFLNGILDASKEVEIGSEGIQIATKEGCIFGIGDASSIIKLSKFEMEELIDESKIGIDNALYRNKLNKNNPN